MKNIFRLAALCAFVAGVAGSTTACGEDTPAGEETLAAPTGLAVGVVTTNAAALSWNAVPNAETYTVTVNGTARTVTTPAFNATGLTQNTDYNWTVQAAKGNITSAAISGPAFKTEKEPVVIPVPGNNASEVTGTTSATVRWGAVTGATAYKLRLGKSTSDYTTIDIAGGETTSHDLTDLESNTSYNWAVAAVTPDGESAFSGWSSFRTQAEVPVTELVYAEATALSFTSGAGEVAVIYFYSYDPRTQSNGGLVFAVDAVIGKFTYPANTLRQYTIYNDFTIDIPAGIYNYDYQSEKFQALSNVIVWTVDGNGYGSNEEINGGSMTVSGDQTGYTIELNVTTPSGETYRAKYVQPLKMRHWTGFVGNIDFGAIPRYNEVYYLPNETVYTGDPQEAMNVDVYLTTGYNGQIVTSADDYIYIVNILQFHAEALSGEIIPDGTYNIVNGLAPGELLAGYWSLAYMFDGKSETYPDVALWCSIYQGDTYLGAAPIVSGTINSTYNDGMYTFVVDGVDIDGNKITGTITDDPAKLAAAKAAPYAAAVKSSPYMKLSKGTGVAAASRLRTASGMSAARATRAPGLSVARAR